MSYPNYQSEMRNKKKVERKKEGGFLHFPYSFLLFPFIEDCRLQIVNFLLVVSLSRLPLAKWAEGNLIKVAFSLTPFSRPSAR